MAKITKQLKNATFEYDEEKKVFTLYDHDGFNGTIELNKIYAFAFMRFVVRMAQRNWLRSSKSKIRESQDTNEELEVEDPNQLNLF
jgi:hypothetical protein